MGTVSGGIRNRKVVIGIVMVLVIIISIFLGMKGQLLTPEPVQASEVTIEAVNSDSLGIEPDTEFLLNAKEPIDEKTVRNSLKLSPEFTYKLDKQAGGTEYRIVPQEELKPNTIYTMAFAPEGVEYEKSSWAFQTKSDFRILRSLPADKSSHVPVDTGIEVTFSHENYDIEKIEDHFTISPHTEGTFEKHKKTVVFIPKGLEPSTIYTITLKKGLPLTGTPETLKEDFVFSFETRSAEQEQPAFEFNMDTDLNEFGTADKPAFSVYINHRFNQNSNRGEIPPLHIDLYRYPDYKTFQTSLAKRDLIPRWSYFAWNGYREELNSQYKTAGYDTEFLSVDQYQHYIIFPEELEEGYYAAEFKADDAVKQVWFQVSDLAVYSAQGEENTLFWVNDLQTGKPVPDTEVIIDSKNLAVRGDDSGVVFVKEDLLGEKRDYALIKSGNKELLVPLGSRPEYLKDGPRVDDFWRYLYLDRELYQPEDTVNFWGILTPRSKDDKLPQNLKLELRGTSDPLYIGGQDTPIIAKDISISNKTFTGQMKLPVLKPGYYYLQLKAGDVTLLSRGFSVETYQKPSYKLSLAQDKKAILAGEKVEIKAQTTFFEGTPVPGVKLNYQIQNENNTVTTNDKGEAVISYTGSVRDGDLAPYRSVYIGVNAVMPEVGEIYSSTDLYVFKSKVYLTGEAKRQGDIFTLNARLNTVDLTDINKGMYLAEKHFLKEPVPNSQVKASLYQEIWTKVEAGQRYNFITKKVEKTYHYNYSTKHLDDFELTTDVDGRIEYTGELDPENSYYLELTATDNEGRSFTHRVHIGSGRYNSPDYQHYYLITDPGIESYKPGDQVLVTMMVNDKEVAPADKGILFYSGQKVIDTYHVSGISKYSFDFKTEHIPNINVYGVYFDGINYQEANSVTVPFAKETKSLKADIKTDKTEYRPEEKVKLEVLITDTDDTPVQGASVNLNLVDEALFSLREQNVDLLQSLYGDFIYSHIYTRKSHYHPELRGGAEQGGEGESERKDFRDTVLFTTVQTDKSGRVEVEFELPDNLTSWRVTYHTFTDDLQAGSGTHQIPVKLPFFVEMGVNSSYLKGDSPIVILRSFGEKLKINEEVSYSIKLIDPQGEAKTWEEKGVAFTPADIQLPELKAGKYSLTVTAASSGFKDILTKEFMVADSFQERTVTGLTLLQADQGQLENYTELFQEVLRTDSSPSSPVTLIFSDYEKGQYLRGLYSLAWSNGSRLEQKLASLEARTLLQEYFPAESGYEERLFFTANEDPDSLLLHQKPDGGISILPYAESELYLSAMVASTSPELFDGRALSGYFYRVLEGEDTEDDRSLALLGLAALKEPVLLKIKNYLLEEKLEPGVRINLALALLEIGDGAYAQEVYKDLISLYGEDLGAVTRINAGRDQNEIVLATTQMALLAARLDQPEKHELYQYLLENPGTDILNSVEQLQILKYNLRYMEPAPVSFTYELDGKKVTKSLQGTEIFKLTLLPEELKKISFSKVEGKVGIMSTYTVPVRGGETGNSEDLSINRTYMVGNTKTTRVDRSDLVKVVINVDIGDKAPSGLYEIVDVLPAGLTNISHPYDYNPNSRTLWDYPSEVNGQKLVFLVGKGKDEITYLARVVSLGEYICEAPILNNIKNNTIYSSGSMGRIVIE